jgi:hypothetical protein
VTPWPAGGVHLQARAVDGTPAEPATFKTTVLVWNLGDRIPIGPGRTLQAVCVRDDDADQAPVLVIEDLV